MISLKKTRSTAGHLITSVLRWFDSESNIESITPTDQKEVDWLRIVPLLFLHLMCLGFFWWEIEITYYAQVLLARLGIVSDLRSVPEHVIRKNIIIAETSTPI